MQIQPILGYFWAIFGLYQPSGPPFGSRPPLCTYPGSAPGLREAQNHAHGVMPGAGAELPTFKHLAIRKILFTNQEDFLISHII